MRMTLTLNDELVAQARELTGIKQDSLLFKEALTALVQRESARRLVRLGVGEPGMAMPPMRRFDDHIYDTD